GHEQRLVRRVHVAQPPLALHRFDALTRLVEIATELDDLGAERAHRGVLFRIVADRNDDRARHTFTLTCERDRLAMIPRARRDDAAPLVGRQSRDQVQATADLECAGGIVILMLDVDVEAGLGTKQGMDQKRRWPDRTINSRPRREYISKRRSIHAQPASLSRLER